MNKEKSRCVFFERVLEQWREVNNLKFGGVDKLCTLEEG
jgi:hypothetical protein